MKGNIFLILVVSTAVTMCNSKNSEVRSGDVSQTTTEIDTSLIATSADLYYKSKMYDSALRQYSQLISTDSLNGKYHYRMGVCKARLKMPNEAISSFLKAAKFNYREKDAYEAIGMTYYIILLNDELALRYFEKAQAIEYDSEIQKTIDKLKKVLPKTNT